MKIEAEIELEITATKQGMTRIARSHTQSIKREEDSSLESSEVYGPADTSILNFKTPGL